jgi:hypothetical protein
LGGPGNGAGEVAGVARWRTIGKEAAWPPWQVRSDYGGTVKRGAVNRPPLPRRARDKASNDGDANETLCGPRWMSAHRSRDHGIFGREVARSRDVAGGCDGTHAFAAGGTFAWNSHRAGAGEHALSGELARGGWQAHHPSLATRPGATLSREFARRFAGPRGGSRVPSGRGPVVSRKCTRGEGTPALSVFLRGDPWLESCCRAERMA